LSLSDVSVHPGPGAEEVQHEMLYVKGTSIRFVHLPEDADAEKLMKNRVRQSPPQPSFELESKQSLFHTRS
ncbi:MAG: hypothetical protein SGPRY_003844, partial [Prymnesium sp.]